MAESDVTSNSGSSVPSRSEHAPTSTATTPDQADLTVVSTLPPAEVGAATATLDPRQLGQALEGQQLDHVLLEKFVGGGGMGAVFRAWDTNLHRTVAVKVLSMRQAGDVESQRRFQIEARSAARLDHPNIARAHYVGEDRGVQYIVFEYIDGTNVRDYIDVTDLADAHLRAIEATGAAEGDPRIDDGLLVCNLGNGDGFTNLEVLRAAEAIVGRAIPHRIGPRRPGDPPTLVASAIRAADVLDWRPQRPRLEEMVRSAWAWRKAHPGGYAD